MAQKRNTCSFRELLKTSCHELQILQVEVTCWLRWRHPNCLFVVSRSVGTSWWKYDYLFAPRTSIRGHKGQNSRGTRFRGFLVLESRCRGFLVLESQCRGFLVLESRCRGFLVLGSRCRGMCVSAASFSFSLRKQKNSSKIISIILLKNISVIQIYATRITIMYA